MNRDDMLFKAFCAIIVLLSAFASVAYYGAFR